MPFIALDGYVVKNVTEKAIILVNPYGDKYDVVLPKARVQGGDELEPGDTDIVVEKWYVEKYDLRT